MIIPFGPIKHVQFTTMHCMDRLVERHRNPGQLPTVGVKLKLLEKMLKQSVPLKLKDEVQVKKLLLNGCESVEYWGWMNGASKEWFQDAGPPASTWVMVVKEGNILSTVHQNDSREWVFL